MTPEHLRGRYEPLDVVGRGGQGEVIKAFDHQHGRVVAIKVRQSESPEKQEALLDEARTLLNLESHPGLPIVREDFFEDHHYYMVMDWIEGTNLQHVLEQRGDPGLPYVTVVDYLAPIAEALDHLHAQEPPVVHGDVKPANLILTPRERVVLVDFGIATTTHASVGVGTRGYYAPELAAGEERTPAVDIYGLAATAYSLLTGTPPRGHRPLRDAMAKDGLRSAATALGPALSVDPRRRPGSASEFVERLRTSLEAQPATAGEARVSSTVSIAAPLRLRDRISWGQPLLLSALISVVAASVAVVLVTSPWRDEGLGLPPVNSVALIDAGNNDIVRSALVGVEPTRVALAQEHLWVTNFDDMTVSRVDPRTGQVIRVVSSDGTPTDIAADAQGIWIANQFDGTVVKIDPRSNDVESTIDLARGARDIALGEGSVWVTNIIDETLTKLDPNSAAVIDTIDLPGTPEDVAVGLGSVWIPDGSNQELLRIDPRNLESDDIALRAVPSTVAVGEGAIWVASTSEDSVTRVDPETRSVAAVPVGNGPAGLAAGGGAVWVANYLSGDVSRIDPDTLRIVATIPVGNSPEGIAVDESNVWITVNAR